MSAGNHRFRDLEAAIDRVVESYGSGKKIDNLRSAALPNKRSILEAYHHLEAAIYLGFFSTRSLADENLHHSVSECLVPAYELLVDAIARATSYEERLGRSEPRRPGFSAEVVLQLIHALPELRRVLDGDVQAAYDGDPAAKSVEEIVFSYPGIRAITAHRIAHYLYRARVPMIPRIIAEHAHMTTGIDIHSGAEIGERFFIDHGTGVVIGETARIGNDVKLYHGVTLGALSVSRSFRGQKRHPTLEDRVTVYSGATILGGDTVIGADSIIGGNVWLTRSVPPGSKVFGRTRESPPPKPAEPGVSNET